MLWSSGENSSLFEHELKDVTRFAWGQKDSFEPPPTLYSKIRFGLTPTPPLYKRILVTHFQDTVNVKKIKNMKRTNP